MNNKFRNLFTVLLSAFLVFGLFPSIGTAAEQATTKPKIVDVAIGVYHVLALDSDGGVWSLGNNGHSNMGHGDLKDIPTPRKITSLPPIQEIAAGAYHSVALDRDGHV